MTTVYHVTLTLQQDGNVYWRVWKGKTEPYQLFGEGSAFTWAAATHQAGTLLMKLNRRPPT